MRDRDPYPEALDEPPILDGRVPPNDLQAEAACLSAAILDQGAADTVLAVLDDPEKCYSDNHRLILEAIRDLRMARRPVDLVQVATWLRNRQLIQRAGGAAYLGQLSDATPSVANVEEHARSVLEKWQQRKIIETARIVTAEGYGKIPNHREWVSAVEKRLFEVTAGHEKRHPVEVGPVVESQYEKLTTPAQVNLERVLTGFHDFDEEIGGWFVGDLMVYAARPGMGKSALVQRKLRNICLQRWAPEEGEAEGPLRYECLLFSPEMPKEQVAMRLLAQESGVDLGKIRRGGPYQPAEARKLEEARDRLRGLTLHVDDTPGISGLEIISKVRRFTAAVRDRGRQVGGVVLDYLQKSHWPGFRHSERAKEVGKLTGELKNMAMDLTIPVVALSQLNRGTETRATDRRPQLADLRESGDIEQDADLVAFIYRESYYSKSADKKAAELVVEKQRNGTRGIVPVGFWSWCTRFTNLADA